MMNIPRPEYPRPRLVRADETFLNLNGEWEFENDPVASGKDRDLWNKRPFPKKILVPFAPESGLSGIEEVDFTNAVWYRRSFTLDKVTGRVLLHFGAVDYRATVRVNGAEAGTHRGGYVPFTFDITALVKEGENEITVLAEDNTRDPMVPSGKQSPLYQNYACYYTRTTGIWQTVWIELVPETYIENTKLTPDPDNRALHCLITLKGDPSGKPIRAEVMEGDKVLFSKTVICGKKFAQFTLEFPENVEMKLWDIDTPNLYDLRLSVCEDTAVAYFGMRKVALSENALLLNGRPVFMRLVLDQGFYPDGIYTAPSDEALKHDIELSKKVGFNGARLHMKIFEPRLIYHADRLGYLLWGEFENWGLDDSLAASYLSIQPEFLSEMLRDYNSPAIIGWCAFNETTVNRNKDVYRAMYNDIRAFDPMRPIIDTSGYTHVITDIYDVHDYNQDPVSFRQRYNDELCAGKVFRNHADAEVYEGQPYFVSEFGGTHWDIDRTGDAGWGYGAGPKDLNEFYARFEGLVTALLDSPKVCGYCYTQLTDVFQEKNGIYSFDRREKFDAARLFAIQTKKAAIEK